MFPRNTLVMSRWKSTLPAFVRRAVQVDQMEMDSALSQMYSLCTNPSLVSKMSRARMMTKGHYYRDDPAFLVLQLGFLASATIAYSFVFSDFGHMWGGLFFALLWFFLSGLVLACVGRAVAVIYLSSASSSAASAHDRGPDGASSSSAASGTGLDAFADYLRSDVDWRYAFDVHCNSYFTFFMWTQVFQYPFLMLTRNSTALANLFYLAGATTYMYNTFLGYLEIPSLAHQQRLLYAVLIAVALYLLFFVWDFNISTAVWCWTWGTLKVCFCEN